MKYLAILLHFYQPPTQLPEVTRKITQTCYSPLSQLILRHPHARFTVNFNYSLTEQLVRLGHEDVIRSFSRAAGIGHIEFTESSAYHYILPLSTREVVLDQVKRNYLGNRLYFGEKEYRPRGVFPPEMAYSPELPPIIQEAGYEWTVADDVALATTNTPVPYDHIITVNALPVLLRSRRWSSRIGFSSLREQSEHLSGEEYLNWLNSEISEWFGAKDGYIIVALDAETFGHHMAGYIERFLENLLDSLDRNHDIRLCTISDILHLFPQRTECNLSSCSWSTSEDQLRQGDPFPLWDSPHNPIHKAHWALVQQILQLIKKDPQRVSDPNVAQAQYSCQFWWANPGIFFDPSQVIRGAIKLLEILFALKQDCVLSEEEVCQTLDLYYILISQLQQSCTSESSRKLVA